MSAHVLLVEDDNLVVRSVARTLRRAGYAVTTAGHGAEALEALAEASFDVVLSDVWMPVMDGWKLLEAIQARYPGLPVVLFTGLAFEREDAVRKGAAELLYKPMTPATLTETLERALTGDPTTEEVGR